MLTRWRERAHARDRAMLLEVIRDQNDRIMELSGKPWNLPPRPVVEEQPVKQPADDLEEV